MKQTMLVLSILALAQLNSCGRPQDDATSSNLNRAGSSSLGLIARMKGSYEQTQILRDGIDDGNFGTTLTIEGQSDLVVIKETAPVALEWNLSPLTADKLWYKLINRGGMYQTPLGAAQSYDATSTATGFVVHKVPTDTTKNDVEEWIFDAAHSEVRMRLSVEFISPPQKKIVEIIYKRL